MPYWKKAYNARPGVYYPQAIVQGEPVETKDLAEELAQISTVSKFDVNAVLGDIARVMNTLMANGKSVHIDGLGYFRYVLDTKGVENLEDFDFQKQVKAVRVQFTPEREKNSSGSYTRALVDTKKLEWIELNPDAKDQDPAQGGGTTTDPEGPGGGEGTLG